MTIELTEKQIQDLNRGGDNLRRVENPTTHEVFVLVPVDEYVRLKAGEYDDSDWTREELERAAWAVFQGEDWEEYDDPAEKT